MAKFKLTLAPLPSFMLPVKFNMPNGEQASIVFKVRHRKASEIQDLYARENVRDVDFIMEIAEDWDLKGEGEEFNEENVKVLIGYYPAAALALTQTYISALAGQRSKN